MNAQFGRGRATAAGRLEAELPAWLRGFDPGEAPIALRVRISRDLRLETPLHAHVTWLVRGPSSIAAAMFLVVVAALVLLGTIGGRLGGAVGSPGSGWPSQAAWPPVSPTPFAGPNQPMIAVLLLVVSALVGAGVYLGPVRRLARLAVGGTEPTTVELLAMPRHLRDVSIRTRVLAILPAVLVVWYLTQLTQPTMLDILMVTAFLPATFAFAIALRYPIRDGATGLMFAGGLALLAQPLVGLIWQVANVVGFYDVFAPPPIFMVLQITQSALPAAGYSALAAGLMGRSGLANRPPLALCAAVAGATFLLTATNFVVWATTADGLDSPFSVSPELLANVASSWINLIAWLVILWVGAAAVRRPGSSPGWRLVLASGATVAALYVLGQASYWLSQIGIGWAPDLTFWLIADGLAIAGLLLALLVGLRPVADDAPNPDSGASRDIATP
jgi:hypothetical protein